MSDYIMSINGFLFILFLFDKVDFQNDNISRHAFYDIWD